MSKKDLRQMKNSKQGSKASLNKEDIYEAAKKVNINADLGRRFLKRGKLSSYDKN